MLIFIMPDLDSGIVWERVEKEKTGCRRTVFTRFSFLNKLIIAQKKGKVKPSVMVQ